MSSSNGSTDNQAKHRSRGHGCGEPGQCGHWSGINIAAMVLGFVIFWPLGLFVLFWIISGRSVKDLPRTGRRLWSKMTGFWLDDGVPDRSDSDNAVFNEYQQTQYDRIREIKEEIKARARRFQEYRAKAKRRVDEEEFNEFMSNTPGRTDG